MVSNEIMRGKKYEFKIWQFYCFKTYCTVLLGHICQRANQVSNVFECSWMYLKCLNVRECVRSSEKFLWWCSSCVKGNLRWHLATACHHNHPIQLLILKFTNMCVHTFCKKKFCLGPSVATHSSRIFFVGKFANGKIKPYLQRIVVCQRWSSAVTLVVILF